MDTDTIAGGALFVLAIVVVLNYRNGTLGQWAKAKFLNSANPKPKAKSESFSGGVTGQTIPPAGLGGGLLTPVSGPITSVWGDARPGGRSHKGIDIGAAEGTPIAAANNGRVTYAGASGDYGLRVDIDQGNGLVTRYGHLSTLGVSVGQTVDLGDVIGKVGHTGDATGPHLHFEVLENGLNVNPATMFGPAFQGSTLS